MSRVLDHGDRTECLICHKCYIFVGSHIHAHGVTADEYREQFGLNRGHVLCSPTYSEFHRDKFLKEIETGVIIRLPKEELARKMLIIRPKHIQFRRERLDKMSQIMKGPANKVRNPDVREKISHKAKIANNRPERKALQAVINKKHWEGLSPEQRKTRMALVSATPNPWNERGQNKITVTCAYPPCGVEFQKWPCHIKEGRQNFCCRSHRAKTIRPAYLLPENKESWKHRLSEIAKSRAR